MGTGDEKRMKQFTYVITDEIGIHARPAGLLAKQFQSTVMLTCNGKSAAATKLMAVMGMGVKHGDPVEVSIEGPDEDIAYEAMEKFFQENL
jgi:phosphocarrier protein HPr